MAIAGYLKQSTAVTLKVGPFVDETDGKTAETSLTISQADVRLSKNGGNMAQKNESTSLTHDEIGMYDCPLNTTDTNTLGILTVNVHESGALPVRQDYMVLAANVYDSLVGGGDTLDVNASVTASDIAAALVALNIGGTAQSGAAGTITLAAGASASNDEYNSRVILIVSGTGAGQAPRLISDYVGATKVATITPNWATEPDNTSVYLILH